MILYFIKLIFAKQNNNKMEYYNQEYEDLIIHEKDDLYIDNRKKILPQDVLSYPYSCYGFITYKNSFGQAKSGTGFLIASDLVLTTASNLLTRLQNGKVDLHSEFVFYPSVSGKIEGSYNVANYKYSRQYVKALKIKNTKGIKSNDYALLKLEKKVIRKKYLSIMCDYEENKEKVSVYGYPQNKLVYKEGKLVGASLVGQTKELQENFDGGLYYKIDTTLGESGSPITKKIGSEVVAIGMHSCAIKNTTTKYGLQFTHNCLSNILKWQLQMSPSQIHIFYPTKVEYQPIKVEDIFDLVTADSRKKSFWDIQPQFSYKFRTQYKKVTSVSLDKEYYQITSSEPIKYNRDINFKVKRYGEEGWGIGFGLITQSRKYKQQSGRRKQGQEESLCYWSWKDGFLGEYGQVNLDGKRIVNPDQKYYLKENSSVTMNFYQDKMKVNFHQKNKEKVSVQLGEQWLGKDIYLFAVMCEGGAEIEVM